MSFAPVLPMGGLAGWGFLKRTQETQAAAFTRQASVQREEAYFRDRIASVETAEDLVNDPRLLRVALSAFGLEADVNNRYFIRKVLEDGTTSDSALANRLADKRYLEFATAFRLHKGGVPRTGLTGFADGILSQWKTRSFEAAVGSKDETYRLALNAERELAALAQKDMSNDARWFTVMGSTPLRKVFETALALPPSFGALDIDRQLAVFKEKAAAAFGSSEIAQFEAPEKMEALVRRYLLRADQAAAPATSPALMLLQAARR